MSVPDTFTGQHADCGGTITFHPAAERTALLAGDEVSLSAFCDSCSRPVSIRYALSPEAVMAASVPEADTADEPEGIPAELEMLSTVDEELLEAPAVFGPRTPAVDERFVPEPLRVEESQAMESLLVMAAGPQYAVAAGGGDRPAVAEARTSFARLAERYHPDGSLRSWRDVLSDRGSGGGGRDSSPDRRPTRGWLVDLDDDDADDDAGSASTTASDPDARGSDAAAEIAQRFEEARRRIMASAHETEQRLDERAAAAATARAAAAAELEAAAEAADDVRPFRGDIDEVREPEPEPEPEPEATVPQEPAAQHLPETLTSEQLDELSPWATPSTSPDGMGDGLLPPGPVEILAGGTYVAPDPVASVWDEPDAQAAAVAEPAHVVHVPEPEPQVAAAAADVVTAAEPVPTPVPMAEAAPAAVAAVPVPAPAVTPPLPVPASVAAAAAAPAPHAVPGGAEAGESPRGFDWGEEADADTDEVAGRRGPSKRFGLQILVLVVAFAVVGFTAYTITGKLAGSGAADSLPSQVEPEPAAGGDVDNLVTPAGGEAPVVEPIAGIDGTGSDTAPTEGEAADTQDGGGQ